MKPTIIFYTALFSKTGGGQHAMTLLAQQLQQRGYEVVLFTRPPFDPSHRYVSAIREAGIYIEVLPSLETGIVARIGAVLTALAIALPYSLVRRKSPAIGWRVGLALFLSRIAQIERRYIRRRLNRVAAGSGQQSKPVILQVWGPTTFTPFLFEWASDNAVPAIYHEMGEADEQYVKTWHLEETVESINLACRVICCSESVADKIRKVYRYNGEICTVPFMIADPEDVKGKPAANKNGAVTFGAIGRLVPHKRHADLLHAVRDLNHNGNNVRLLIAGSGPSRSSLEQLAADLGIKDRVFFTGEFNKLGDVMSELDVFALTSASESQCMPITESMAYGKPVIASRFGGIPDFVEDGVTGYLVEIGDHDGLVGAMKRLVDDRALRERMGEQGRSRYVASYSAEEVTNEIERIYLSIQNDRLPAAGLKLGYFFEYYATFIADEVNELERLGAKVEIFNAFRPFPEPDPRVERLRARSFYLPPRYRGVALASVAALVAKPVTYLKLARLLLSERESLRMLILASYYARIIKSRRIQHLHGTFGTRTTTLAHVTAKLAGIDYSFTTHAYDVFNSNPSLVWKTSESRFMRVISDFNKQYIEEAYAAIDGSRIHVRYLGVDTDRFRRNTNRRTSDGIPCIVSVGSLVHQKGHEYLIRACAELRDRRLAFRCDIIGDGAARDAFQSIIDQLSLNDRVFLLGQLGWREVETVLNEAATFALPCIDMRGQGEHVDGIPVALMEAMSMELAVVSTSVSGIPELIEDGVSGMLVPQRDVLALADALEHIISDQQLRTTMGQSARAAIREKFNLETNTKELIKLFTAPSASLHAVTEYQRLRISA